MQIVIDIPEDVKEKIAIMGLDRLDVWNIRLVSKAISDGIPLPKGHGRLIDADSVNNIIHPIDSFDCEWAVTGETVKKLIYDVFDKADTIIEADTERSEDAKDNS